MRKLSTSLASAAVIAAMTATPFAAVGPAHALNAPGHPMTTLVDSRVAADSSAAGAGSLPATRRTLAASYPFFVYGPDPRPRNAYDDDGWGTAPARSKQLGLAHYSGGAVRIRKRLVPLVNKLFWLTEHVYGYKVKPRQTFGYAPRSVRGGSRISNHGRGLAIDINSLANPMSTSFRSNLPPRLIRIWEQHGFDWGGYYRSRPDAMHFEFADGVSDVDRYVRSARKLVRKHQR